MLPDHPFFAPRGVSEGNIPRISPCQASYLPGEGRGRGEEAKEEGSVGRGRGGEPNHREGINEQGPPDHHRAELPTAMTKGHLVSHLETMSSWPRDSVSHL